MIELVFIHLPKTGGSSILETLNQVYGKEHVRHFERDECIRLTEQSKEISDVISDSTKVIHGHFLFSEVANIIHDFKPKVVTFMRDPVQRVISNYSWWKHTLQAVPNHPASHRVNEPLSVYITREEVQNKIARFLDGIEVEKFFFIGFLESFEQDLKRLGDLLNWSEVPVFHKKNRQVDKSKAKEALDKETLNKIRSLNSKDLVLYLEAQRRFKS